MWRLSYAPNMAQCPNTGDFFNNSPNKIATIHRTKPQQFTEQNRHNSPKIWLNYCFTETYNFAKKTSERHELGLLDERIIKAAYQHVRRWKWHDMCYDSVIKLSSRSDDTIP